jgi:putative flippase GtrA
LIEVLKFLVAGGLNTGLTYLVYLAALTIVPYVAAYTIAYIAGIGISYILNTYFVFKEKVTIRKALAFPLVYLVQYLAGAGLLVVFVKWVYIPETYAPLLVVVATLPLTFYLSKRVIKFKPEE